MLQALTRLVTRIAADGQRALIQVLRGAEKPGSRRKALDSCIRQKPALLGEREIAISMYIIPTIHTF